MGSAGKLGACLDVTMIVLNLVDSLSRCKCDKNKKNTHKPQKSIAKSCAKCGIPPKINLGVETKVNIWSFTI